AQRQRRLQQHRPSHRRPGQRTLVRADHPHPPVMRRGRSFTMNAIRNRMRQTMRSDARRRGSVLLFSIIVVLLLTMMGAAYLQMARVDRRATRAVDTRSQDVEGSIIRYIAGILAADVLQSGAEHYDHPWTNSA